MRARTSAAGSLALTLVVILTVLELGPADQSAGAQARPVLVDVRTTPELPEPGDDVAVRVSIQGCPPGPAAVEIYLETNDGVSRTTDLMARQPARTSMMWSLRTTLPLSDAAPGWYGVRVVCGTFRPAREPLATTRFVVGARPNGRVGVAAPEVPAGTSITVTGDQCRGDSADASLTSTADAIEEYEPDVEVLVSPDGTWSIDLPVPAGTRPGRVSVRARCLATNQYGRRIALPYQQWLVVTITAV